MEYDDGEGLWKEMEISIAPISFIIKIVSVGRGLWILLHEGSVDVVFLSGNFNLQNTSSNQFNFNLLTIMISVLISCLLAWYSPQQGSKCYDWEYLKICTCFLRIFRISYARQYRNITISPHYYLLGTRRDMEHGRCSSQLL